MTLYTDPTIKTMINITRNELFTLFTKSRSDIIYLVLASEHSQGLYIPGFDKAAVRKAAPGVNISINPKLRAMIPRLSSD